MFRLSHFLCESQEAPSFKKWFKGSKVVDSEGNPLEVFHGTSADFDRFDTRFAAVSDGGAKHGYGFYFTSQEDEARNYADLRKNRETDSGTGIKRRLMAVYLKITKPILARGSNRPLTILQVKNIITNAPNHKESLENFGEISPEAVKWGEGYANVLNTTAKSYAEESKYDLVQTIHKLQNDFFAHGHELEGFADVMKKYTKYDGVLHEDGNTKHWVVWHPDQIKVIRKLALE